MTTSLPNDKWIVFLDFHEQKMEWEETLEPKK